MRSALKILLLSAVAIPALLFLGRGAGWSDPAAQAGDHRTVTFYVA